MQDILTIFNSKEKNEIKEAIKNMILETIKKELEDNSYLLDTTELISNIIDDAVDEVEQDIKNMYKQKLIQDFITKYNTNVKGLK